MRILIDGYNLLHAIGFGNITSPHGKLEPARDELLRFLQASLTEPERAATVIVFDTCRTRGRPNDLTEVGGMSVEFASGYASADERIVELIREHRTPQQLLVVSSDHHIQKVARQRRAGFVDSEPWYEELVRRERHAKRERSRPIPDEPAPDMQNPFPPGYAQDVERDQKYDPFPPGYGEDVS